MQSNKNKSSASFKRKKGERRKGNSKFSSNQFKDSHHGGSSNNGYGGNSSGGNNSNSKSKTPQDLGAFKSLIQGFASTAGAKFSSSLGSNTEADRSQAGLTTPGKFDLYLFAQSWAPRFCCTNNKQCKKEGMENTDDLLPHGKNIKHNFSKIDDNNLLGLWPAYFESDKSGRTYPAYCHQVPDKGGRAEHEW